MAAKPAFLVYEIDDLALTLDLCLFAKAEFKPKSVVRACLYFGFLEEWILFGF